MDGPNFNDRLMTVDDVLAHYGIKGMHWGIRRKNPSANSSSSSKPAASEDHQTVQAHRSTIKSGGLKALSNKELQEVVTRMNLEQQYGNLRSKEPTKFSQGQAAIKQILSVAKTGQEVYSTINSPAVKVVKEALKNR